MPVVHKHLLPLPARPGCGEYLYAFEFANGIVKIGASGNPRLRAQSLQCRLRSIVVRFHVLQVAGRGKHKLERRALESARKTVLPCRGREYFYGLSFDDAIRSIEQSASHSHPAEAGQGA